MSGRIWVISDTHFGHANILNFKRNDGTPLRSFEDVQKMDETMIRLWNERVHPEDHVYHLGDVVINKKFLSIIPRLMGKKRLVRGNHDIYKTREYIEAGFQEIHGCRVFKANEQQGTPGAILTHIPIHPGSLPRWGINVHGHTHYQVVRDSAGHPDPKYVCVSVEHTDYAPVLLDDIVKGKKNVYKDRQATGSML